MQRHAEHDTAFAMSRRCRAAGTGSRAIQQRPFSLIMAGIRERTVPSRETERRAFAGAVGRESDPRSNQRTSAPLRVNRENSARRAQGFDSDQRQATLAST
jgi:hypothetical protein